MIRIFINLLLCFTFFNCNERGIERPVKGVLFPHITDSSFVYIGNVNNNFISIHHKVMNHLQGMFFISPL